MRRLSPAGDRINANEGSFASAVNRCRRIVLMGVDIHAHDNDSFFWNSVRSLGDADHNIIIVRNRGMSERAVRQINFPHIQIGAWIPRSIYGWFRSFMYIIRSAYTAAWVSYNLRTTLAEFEPTLVVSDASCVAVPILSAVGGFQVICFEYFKELLAEFDPYNEVGSPLFNFFVIRTRRFCLSRAEMILIPCPNARELLQFEEDDERVHVVYPPAEGEYSSRYDLEYGFPRIMHGPRRLRSHNNPPHPLEVEPRLRYQFVAVDVFEPTSNFHVLIDAFMAVVEQLDVHQPRLSLQLVGSWYTMEQRIYRRMLRRQIREARAHFPADISLHSNVGFETRCTFYRSAFAVLNANTSSRYIPSVIEAFYFARVLITADSDFVGEVVRDNITGIVVPSVPEVDADSFAQIMLNLLFNEGPTYRFMAMAASDDYDRDYSFENFSMRLHQLVGLLNRQQNHES